MKITSFLFAAVLVLVACSVSYAQRRPAVVPFVNEQTNKPLTQLEAWQEFYGQAIIKGYTELPRIRGVNGTLQITIVEFQNTVGNARVKGVVADVTVGERLNEKARSYIDYSELDALIKGVTYISKVDKGVTALRSLEAVYTTAGEFSISNFFGFQGDTRVAVTAGRMEPKTVFLDPTSQTTLIGQLQEAKSTLDAL